MVKASKCETCKNCKRYGGTSQITRQNWNCDIGADIIYALVRGGKKTDHFYWCKGIRWINRYKESDVANANRKTSKGEDNQLQKRNKICQKLS